MPDPSAEPCAPASPLRTPPIPDLTHPGFGQAGRNLAECAMVAAKVYEAFQWPRFTPGTSRDYHVPDAEALMETMYRIGCLALSAKEQDHEASVPGYASEIRLQAYADDDGEDSYVDFYITVGSVPGAAFRRRPEEGDE